MIDLFAAPALMEAGADVPASPLQRLLTERASAFLADFDIDPEPIDCINELGGGRATRIDRTIWLDAFHFAYEMGDKSYFLNELGGRQGCRGGKNVTISYEVAARQPGEGLCKGDSVVTFSFGGTPSVPVGRCNLGYFYKLFKKPAVDAAGPKP